MLALFYSNVSIAINDPTRPIFSDHTNHRASPTYTVKELQPFLLQSVFYSKHKQSAIINGVVVQQGAMLDGVMLHEVNRQYVVLRYQGKAVNLMMSETIFIDKHTGEVSEK